MADNQKQLGANYRWVNNYEEQITKLKEEINKLQEDLKNAKASLSNSISHVFAKLGSVQEELLEKINNLTTRIEALEIRIDGFTTDITNIKADISDIKTQIETFNTTITEIKNNITSIKNDIETINNNITQLQTDLSTETKARQDGDTAITNRLNNIMFLKWLRFDEFGASDSEPNVIINNEPQIVYYNFPAKYSYTNMFIVSAKGIIKKAIQLYDLETIGVSLDIQDSYDEDNNRVAKLAVKYTPENNTAVDKDENNELIIDILYTQYIGGDPDELPY